MLGVTLHKCGFCEPNPPYLRVRGIGGAVCAHGILAGVAGDNTTKGDGQRGRGAGKTRCGETLEGTSLCCLLPRLGNRHRSDMAQYPADFEGTETPKKAALPTHFISRVRLVFTAVSWLTGMR